VRNCVETAGVASAVLPISVTNPLIAKFQAICNFGACAFGTGDNIPFEDQSTGNPDGYFYNWNNTGADANACASGATGTEIDGASVPPSIWQILPVTQLDAGDAR